LKALTIFSKAMMAVQKNKEKGFGFISVFAFSRSLAPSDPWVLCKNRILLLVFFFFSRLSNGINHHRLHCTALRFSFMLMATPDPGTRISIWGTTQPHVIMDMDVSAHQWTAAAIFEINSCWEEVIKRVGISEASNDGDGEWERERERKMRRFVGCDGGDRESLRRLG
jgi:hypothetical protein